MTALAEPEKKDEKPGGFPVPRDIRDKVKRGTAAMMKDAADPPAVPQVLGGRPLLVRRTLRAPSGSSHGAGGRLGGKPSHRIRNTYNFIQSIVEGKVSAVTQKVPGYEIDPSSTDNEDRQAARIAEQVAFYGYDKWYLRRMGTKVATLALVQREGFAMPYYDAAIGPFANGQGKGEIRVLTFSRSEVMWEPGQDFLESRWHATAARS
jgi:hypothetical protein